MNKGVTLVSLTSLLVLLGSSGCQQGDSSDLQARCDAVVVDLTRCYPDLSLEGICTQETIDLYESYDLSTTSCAAMDDLGKADTFAFAGCAEGEHVCAFIFCCDDYVVTRYPVDIDWDMVDLVDAYQADLPVQVADAVDSVSWDDLTDGISWTWEQSIVSRPAGAPMSMAVELSMRLIAVPYQTFIQRMPPADWGINLAEYIGGERVVLQQDEQDRPTAQVERMVLNAFPCESDTRLGNMDMTKAEWIYYSADGAKVYWRVFHSDNGSVEADVGTVEFWSYDADSTLVQFHSAHRLNTPLGTHVSNDLVQPTLEYFFLRYIERYRQIVGG